MSIIDRLIKMDQIEPKRILVVGDGMDDIYVHGRLEPCQEGCNKFVEESRVTVSGGAANAARSISHWHVERLMLVSSGPIKTRFMIGNKCVFRFDDDTAELDFEVVREHTINILELHPPDAVLISDYNKGVLTPELIRIIISTCNRLNIICVADMKRAPMIYRGAVLKCNSDFQHHNNEELSELVYDADIGESLIVTDGPSNPLIWDKGKLVKGMKFLLPVQCINHVGAGDCFAAHLTLALVYGLPLIDAATIAHSAGRVYVQFKHNRPPHPQEILKDMEGD